MMTYLKPLEIVIDWDIYSLDVAPRVRSLVHWFIHDVTVYDVIDERVDERTHKAREYARYPTIFNLDMTDENLRCICKVSKFSNRSQFAVSFHKLE